MEGTKSQDKSTNSLVSATRDAVTGLISACRFNGEPYIAANGVPVEGGNRIYGFSLRRQNFRSFFSRDGLSWTAEAGVRLALDERSAPGSRQIKDPTVLQLADGSHLMVYVARLPETQGNPQGNLSERRNPVRQGCPPENVARPPGPQSGVNVDGNANGPWNRDVLAYRVGPDGSVEKTATFERAGVPTLARLGDDRLFVAHQHFPENDEANFDKVAVRFSDDDGRTWGAPQVIQVAGLPEGMRFPCDPTLVPLPDGRVRLYFSGNMGRTFQRSTPAIHSAISTDGVNYSYEPGARFALEGRIVIDCAVVLHVGIFHLYVPDNGTQLSPGEDPRIQTATDRPREGVGYHATSTDGLNFTRADDVRIEGRRRWLGNSLSDGKIITFYGTGEGRNTGDPGGQPQGGLWMATSEDGQSWEPVANPPISGGDPGAVRTHEGGLLVVTTGPPRTGRVGGAGLRSQNFR